MLKETDLILIIDDNKENLKKTVSTFREAGLKPIFSNDIKHAETILTSRKIDLSILFINDEVLMKDLSILNFINKYNIYTYSHFFTTPNSISNILEEHDDLKSFFYSQTNVTNKQTCLIIEDNELNLIYYKELFENLNFNVTTSNLIKEGKDNLKTKLFNLIICDYKLTDGNYEDLYKFMLTTININSPVVLISGYNKIELPKELEYSYAIQKPITQNQINNILKQLNLNTETNNIDEIKSDPKKYDYSSLIHYLKNDEKKVTLCINEFIDILSETKKQLTNSSEDIQETLRSLFHDILNLSNYFGGEKLTNLINLYRSEKESLKKMAQIPSIQEEVNNLLKFYLQLQENRTKVHNKANDI